RPQQRYPRIPQSNPLLRLAEAFPAMRSQPWFRRARVRQARPRTRVPSRRSRRKRRRRITLSSVPILYTSQDQIEVYRFSLPTAILVPLAALFLQAFVPLRFPAVGMLDLPLLVVIFFAVARRSQVSGLLTGAVIGLLQDSLTHQPIGLYGIS